MLDSQSLTNTDSVRCVRRHGDRGYSAVLYCVRKKLRAAGLLAGAAFLVVGTHASSYAATDYNAAEMLEGQSRMIGPVESLQVRPDVYLLTVEGINVTLQTGPDGSVVVDPGPASASNALIEAIRTLTPEPIRLVIDTSGDPELIGGNASLAEAGRALMTTQLDLQAPIIARQNVLNGLIAQPGEQYSAAALPTEVFARPQYGFYLNEQGIEVIAEPAAHSDGDSAVRFPRSDVVVTGDIFDDTRFPVIDTKHGGSVQGEIDALNELINREVNTPTPVVTNEQGTVVIPVRGPVCRQADLVNYRDMIFSVRLRVQDLIDRGMSLKQIQSQDPTLGYDSRWGSTSGSWTTADFVQAVYLDLQTQKGRKRQGTGG